MRTLGLKRKEHLRSWTNVLAEANTTAFDVAGIWAQRESAWAENCLGSLYLTGLGIERDLSKAFYLFYRAAKHGNATAWYSMGVLFEVGGDEFPPDAALSNFCYQRAEELGYFPGAVLKPNFAKAQGIGDD